MTAQKVCFVVQGFGEKTDLATGRALNLDASYEVIKEAVQAAGLRCVRADEIPHSGTIDAPMYDQLFRADLVVADLSTSNLNAAYELGVRYGVRPRATIIIAEQQFKNPFDFSHIVIRRYEHLGSDVGRREAARFKAELTEAIRQIMDGDAVDSPFYTFLRLEPPVDAAAQPEVAARRIGQPHGAARPPEPIGIGGAAPAPAAETDAPAAQSAKHLLDIARAEMARDNFDTARRLFETVLQMRPRDEYVLQKLAFATYKARQPDTRSALLAAREHLLQLDPDVTNDPETLGLWGAVHKRLWDIDQDRASLDVAVNAYERGFYLKQDYYNGINLAFLLNVRASVQQAEDRAEALADFVIARRVRREVIRYCERALQVAGDPAAKYWVLATLWEAAFGIGDRDAAIRWQQAAEAAAPEPWMLESTRSQIQRLDQLLSAAGWTVT